MTNPIYEAEREEGRDAVRDLTDVERAPYDDPQTYNDTLAPDGTRYGEQ